MTSAHPRIGITGASGRLGRLVVEALLRSVQASRIVAGLCNPDDDGAKALRALDVEVRQGDYERTDTLDRAFAGIERLLLISSNEFGKRVDQHRNVIEAAKRAGVRRIAYTSVLHADTSPPKLTDEHRRTELVLAASGVPFVILRNGWYTENYAASIPMALEHGALFGSAGQGRISSAARADYADAAAAVLTAAEVENGRIYELAGDDAYTLEEFAAEVAKVSGRPVVYRNLPEAEYEGVLLKAGLPKDLAAFVAASDSVVAEGALFEDGRDLSRLIGRPTKPMRETVAAGEH